MASSKQEPSALEGTNYITNGQLTDQHIHDMKLDPKESLLNHVSGLTDNDKELKVNGNSLDFGHEYDKEHNLLSRKNGDDQSGNCLPNHRDQEPNGQTVTCPTCVQSFELQSYMEHKCHGKESKAMAPETTETEREGEEVCEDGDMESFQGEILYQEDGSAYLVDNSNLPYASDNALKLYKNALGVTPTSGGSPMNHRLVSALHIPTYMTMRNLSQLNISLQGPYGTPMVHSFRVYDVRSSKDNDESQPSEGDEERKEVVTGGNSEFSGRPILMCFLCKLSFGLAKSFLAHATQDHQIEIHAEEKQIMSTKSQSAIIQGADKEPLLSFLELITTKAQKSEPFGPPSIEGGYMPQFLTSSATPTQGYVFPTSMAVSTTSRTPGVITSTKSTSDAAQSIIAEQNTRVPFQLERGPEEGNSPALTPNSQSEEYRVGATEVAPHETREEAEVQNLKREAVELKSPSMLHQSANMGDVERQGTSDRVFSPGVNGETSSPDVVRKDQMEDGEAALGDHAGCSNGRNCNVECPKCDAVLSSSRSLGGHMTMMHSRNSCKTLKCPKCNWHYKYQQTLEAHMKEKHPDDETKCVYCENQEAHPRLSRGESYTCGYKPYRCAICNYSTTTKGNLSIHMQSDKHLNNVQELQTGGEQHFLQAKLGDLAAITKPKQKQTWRCEACDYETSVARNLNIHMTSQKHIQNMMTIHQNVSQMQRELQANLANISPDESLYVAMTQNMIPMMAPGMTEQTTSPVDIQQLMANYQYDPITYGAMMNQLAMSGVNPLEMAEEANANLPDDPSRDEPLSLFHCAVCNRFSTDSFEALFHHVQKDRSEPNTHLWKMVIGDTQQCTLCNYSTQVKANFQLHLKTDKHNQKLNLFNHIREGGKQNEWRLKYMNVGNPVQVRCNACDFYTHSVDKLCSHCHPNNFRHESNMKLFRNLQKINVTYNVISKSFRCSLCNYVTKNKLSLVQHVQTNHQCEGDFQFDTLPKQSDSRPSSEPSPSESNEAALDLSKKEPPGENKVVQEAHDVPMENVSSPTGGGDETNKLMKMFQQFSLPPPDEQQSEGPQVYACPYCKFSTIDKQNMTDHVITQHSLKPQPHLRCPLCQEACNSRSSMEMHLMERHSVSRDCVASLLKSYEPAADFLSQPSTSNQAVVGHHGKTEEESKPVDDEVAVAPEAKVNIPEEKEPDSIDLAKGGPFPDADAADLYRCQNCHKKFANIDLLYSHQERVCPLTEQDTPRGPGFLCWKRGCNQYFKSPAGLRTHFKEIHHKHKVPTYNIAAYKFKCSQCTLAFKSRDKLMEHDRTHSMIKCIACQKSFPSPSVLRIHIDTVHSDLSKTDLLQYYNTIPRILEALGAPQEIPISSPPPKTLESSKTLDSKQYSNYGPQQENLLAREDGANDTPEPMIPDEDSYYDPTKTFKCHRCIVGFARQSERTKHERTLQHKNEQNYMMDRYFDPKRPHKCDLCRESFTQKSILLSHLNSVSHLHKLKQSLNEPGDPDAEYLSGEAKPYRCKLCKVSYSTHTTLDTHFRCVLHQSRVKKREAQLGGGQSTATSAIPKQEPVQEGKDTTESPRTATPVTNESQQQKQLHAQLQQQAQMQAQQAHFQQLQFQQIAQMQSYQQAYLQQQIAAHLTGGAAAQGVDPNALLSPELAMMAMAAGFPPSFYHPSVTVPTCSVCSAQFPTQEEVTQHHQQAHGIKKTSSSSSKTVITTTAAIPAVPQQPSPPVCTPPVTAPAADAAIPVKRKRSSAVQRKLLASYGFDLVQQFNEFAQGLPQSIAAEDKYQCRDCPKEFSSVWVYKAHVEEMHKQILDIVKVEQYAQVFRDELLEENEEVEAEARAAIKKEKIEERENSRPSSADLKRKSLASEESKDTPPPKSVTPKEDMVRAIEKLQEQANSPMMPPPSQPHAQQMMLSNAYQLAMLHAMQQPFPGVQSFPGMPAMHQLQQASAVMPPSQQMPFLDPNAAVQSRPGARRGRTRISEDQLKVLKAYFNISNSPADDQIMEMSIKTGLPTKVIKHWFRNTLFKERQKNKDSPYNFNNPPTTTLSDAIDKCVPREDKSKEGHTDHIPKRPKVDNSETKVRTLENKAYQRPPEPEKIREALRAAQAADINTKKESDKKKAQRLDNIIKNKIDMKKDQQRKVMTPSPPIVRAEEMKPITPPIPVIKVEQRKTLTPPPPAPAETALNPVEAEPRKSTTPPPPPPYLARPDEEGSATEAPEGASALSEESIPVVLAEPLNTTLPTSAENNPEETIPVVLPVPFETTAPSSMENVAPLESQTSVPEKAEITESQPSVSENAEITESETEVPEEAEITELKPLLPEKAEFTESETSLPEKARITDGGGIPKEEAEEGKFQNKIEPTTEKGIVQMPSKIVQSIPENKPIDDVYAFESFKIEKKERKPEKSMTVQSEKMPKDGHKSTTVKEESRYDLMPFRTSVSISSTPTSSISDMASPLSSPVSPGNQSMSAVSPPMTTSSGSSMGSSSSRRSGRTRFTDYQIKVLQEFFESNAYPRDEDVEHLSRLLNLNGRVIVVWFQNARQKARKIFENQPAPDLSVDPGDEFRNRDSCLSYQCNKCGFIFQRFHDLIKHQKHLCTGTPVKAGSSQPLMASVPSKPTPGPEKRVSEKVVKEKENPPPVIVKKEPKSCEKCNITFSSPEEWQDHQQMHLMNMGLFGSYFSSQQVPYMYMPYEDGNSLTPEKYMSLVNNSSSTSNVEESTSKRKYSEASDGSDRGNESDHHRDKRLRTTITPAQLDILYSKYQEDSNPTRRMLDIISHEVGLKKRVVQVWFQNTRARERKGQFRISALQQARKCPFCDEMFRSKNAMETHARMRHFDQYTSKEQLEEMIAQAEHGLISPHSDRAASAHSEEGFDGYSKTRPRDQYMFPDDNEHYEQGRRRMEEGHNLPRREDTYNEDYADKFGEGSDELDVYTSEVSLDENASEGTSREADMMSPTSSMVGEELAHSDRAPSEAGSLERSEDSVSNCDDGEHKQRLKDCGKRYRTHMTQFQLKVLKHCFADYRTPIMQECELLGQEVGLQRRVVQVWFQNSRAKEKKVKSNVTKQFGLIGTASDGRPEMCTLCGVKYAGMMSVRDHIFTEQHIRNVKKKVRMSMEKGDNGEEAPTTVQKTEFPSNPEQLHKLPMASHPLAGGGSSSTTLPSPHMSAAQMQAMQAMQAHMMPPFPPQMTFPGLEEKEERPRSSSRHSESSKSKEDRKSEKSKNPPQVPKHGEGSSGYGMMQNVSPGDAALMSYLYGGLAPYYAQMPMMYPVYPMGAEMFYAQDPAMQAAAAFSPHMMQAYAAGNPLLMQQMQQQMQQAMAASSKGGPSKEHKAGSSSSSSDRKNSLSSIKEMELILKPNSSTNRYLCKRCEKVYTDLESVTSHQVTSCFLGQVVKIEETVEKLPSNRFLCQVCPKETLITDEDVLKHLHSFTHQQRAFLSQYEMMSRAEIKKEK